MNDRLNLYPQELSALSICESRTMLSTVCYSLISMTRPLGGITITRFPVLLTCDQANRIVAQVPDRMVISCSLGQASNRSVVSTICLLRSKYFAGLTCS